MVPPNAVPPQRLTRVLAELVVPTEFGIGANPVSGMIDERTGGHDRPGPAHATGRPLAVPVATSLRTQSV